MCKIENVLVLNQFYTQNYSLSMWPIACGYVTDDFFKCMYLSRTQATYFWVCDRKSVRWFLSMWQILCEYVTDDFWRSDDVTYLSRTFGKSTFVQEETAQHVDYIWIYTNSSVYLQRKCNGLILSGFMWKEVVSSRESAICWLCVDWYEKKGLHAEKCARCWSY